MKKNWIWTLAFLLAFGGMAGQVQARKTYPLMVDHLYNQGAVRNGTCDLCHYWRGGGLFTWTPFGRQILETEGGSLAERLDRVAALDADGDGWANSREFTYGTNPNGQKKSFERMLSEIRTAGMTEEDLQQVSGAWPALPFDHN